MSLFWRDSDWRLRRGPRRPWGGFLFVALLAGACTQHPGDGSGTIDPPSMLTDASGLPGDGGVWDAGEADLARADAGPVDLSRPDFAAVDAGPTDLGRGDAGSADAGSVDAGRTDAGATDAGSVDAGRPDAGATDAGPSDAGATDAGATDAGRPDAGLPDAGPVDLGWLDAGATDFATGTDAGGAHRLRVMAANTTSGNKQSYDPGEGLRIFQGLQPDVALIQEFNYGDNSDTAIRGFITTAFGASYSYFRETGAQIPNGVASRYPIIAAGKWTDPSVSNRSFVWAHIDLPGTKDLWAVSVHLLTSSASNRDNEAKALVADIEKTVPAGDYLVIGGDFNTGSRTEACVVTLSKIVANGAPYPADNAGNVNTSASRSKPYDWVMASPSLRSLATSVVIGGRSFASGLIVDSRVYTPLSDIAPVKATDSAALNMQHMAVVEDFLLP